MPTSSVTRVLKDLGISNRDFLGSGCTATAYLKDGQVYKVCSKDIRFFSNYKGGAELFKQTINGMGDIFLPVNGIIHEDRDIFVYTQDLCKPLDKKDITGDTVIKFLTIFCALLKNKCMISGLSPHNLCISPDESRSVRIFDYHGLHKLKSNTLKSSRVARNLVKYMTRLYCPKQSHEYKEAMADFNRDSISKLRKLPKSFLDMLKAMLDSRGKDRDIDRIVSLAERCMDEISTKPTRRK